jgi:Cu2+-exporting ATPase
MPRRSGCRDFKSANSYYLDGKPIQTMHFQELLSAAGNYSIKVFNPNDALLPTEEVTIAPQRMLQENTTPMF